MTETTRKIRRDRMTDRAKERSHRLVIRKDERTPGYLWFDILRPAIRGQGRPVFTQRSGHTDFHRIQRALRAKYNVPGSNVEYTGFTEVEINDLIMAHPHSPVRRLTQEEADAENTSRLGETTGDASDDQQGHDRMPTLWEESPPEADTEYGETDPED